MPAFYWAKFYKTLQKIVWPRWERLLNIKMSCKISLVKKSYRLFLRWKQSNSLWFCMSEPIPSLDSHQKITVARHLAKTGRSLAHHFTKGCPEATKKLIRPSITWISQSGCGKYRFYTEFPNQHLEVKTKKWKYEPAEVGFFNIQVAWSFATTRNLIKHW